MDRSEGDIQEKKEEYKMRFQKALEDNSTYRNCAGFVKYLLGVGENEGLVALKDLSENGLLKFLKPKDKLDLSLQNPLENIEESLYMEKASKARVVGMLVNRVSTEDGNSSLANKVNERITGWMYVHFAYIDPEDPSKVYQRPEIENKPEHTNWENFAKYSNEFEGMDSMIVFFDRA